MTARERYRAKKSIRVQSEDQLSPSLTKKLVNHGWDYKPRNKGLPGGVARGGHWVPPGHQVIPPATKDQNHGKHYAMASARKQALKRRMGNA
jgi:hypothetical protein